MQAKKNRGTLPKECAPAFSILQAALFAEIQHCETKTEHLRRLIFCAGHSIMRLNKLEFDRGKHIWVSVHFSRETIHWIMFVLS